MMMFCFYFFFAILVLVSTNPIPDDLNESNQSTDPTVSNSDLHNDIPPGSGFSSNEVTVTDSDIVADSGCSPNIVTDGNLDDNIQKRVSVCPVTAEPIPKSRPQRPAEAPGKSTSTSDNPCNNEYSHWLSCGGPEVIDAGKTPILAGVLNCVQAVATFIPARYAFPPTVNIAQFCCKDFYNLEPLYTAHDCKKITSEKLLSVTLEWLTTRMRRLTQTPNDVEALRQFLLEIHRLFKF